MPAKEFAQASEAAVTFATNITALMNAAQSPHLGRTPGQRDPVQEEKRLVERLRRGDQRAFDQFFDAYSVRVRAFAARRTSLDSAALEDVVQVVMIKAQRALSDFRGGSSLFTWLCQICRNHLADLRRKAEYQPSAQSLNQLETGQLSEAQPELIDFRNPLDECLSDLTCRAVRRALNLLPSGYARILGLRYRDDLSVSEIAQVLQLSAVAAQSQLARAKQAFRSEWASDRRGPI